MTDFNFNQAVQAAFPFLIFEEEKKNPLSGQQMTATETFIAQLLLEGTSEKPIKMQQIISEVSSHLNEKLSERQLKIIIRSFRRDRAFPILSRRSTPAGYYWCRTIEEMKDFTKMWMSQYFDEIQTLHIMTKHNYPRLAGQLNLKAFQIVDSEK